MGFNLSPQNDIFYLFFIAVSSLTIILYLYFISQIFFAAGKQKLVLVVITYYDREKQRCDLA